jgi:hypothetical protein
MARTSKYFNDPVFNKWLYAVIVNLTPAQKEFLNDRELYSIRDHKAIKSFINTAPQDKIDILLTKVGYKVARVYYATQKLNAQVVKDAYNQYCIKGKTVDVIDEMIRQDFFVVSDRDIAHSLALMSMNCHSSAYELNLSYPGIERTIRILEPKLLDSPSNAKHREADEGLTHMSRLLFGCMSIEAFLKGRYGLTPADMVILLLLFYHRGRWVRISYLHRMTDTMYSKAVIARRASKLFMEWRYIERMTASSEVAKYTIMSKGILVVGEIIRYLVSKELK